MIKLILQKTSKTKRVLLWKILLILAPANCGFLPLVAEYTTIGTGTNTQNYVPFMVMTIAGVRQFILKRR